MPFYFFLLGEQDLTWASFCFRHNDSELGISLIQRPQQAELPQSCLLIFNTEVFKAKIITQGYAYFSFFESIFLFFDWENVNTLTIIPRVYSEFNSMHFKTHWLGRIILTLMNISFTKPSAFASGPG